MDLLNEDEKSRGKRSFGTLCKDALDFTHAWMEHEVQRVIDHEKWKPQKEPSLNVKSRKKYGAAPVIWNLVQWDQEKVRWKEANENYGIITCGMPVPSEAHARHG